METQKETYLFTDLYFTLVNKYKRNNLSNEKASRDGEEAGDLCLQPLVPQHKAAILAQGNNAATAYGLVHHPLLILFAHSALLVL